MKLHYAGAAGEGYGWGVCNANLLRALGDLVELTGPDQAEAIFMPLAGDDLDPSTPARARINVAYTFFESPLGPRAPDNAATYDIVFAGSSWCLERMREVGIANGRLLMQGVDHAIFRPSPRARDGSFRIFSGGKFEWRKGQDLVIAAVAAFRQRHPEANAHLVCAWHNLWAELIWGMGASPHLAFDGVGGGNQAEIYANLMKANGLPEAAFTILPQLGQAELARAMAQTDCGLFPNRCEGGTNLVLMEYLACGRLAVANLLTGHADLAGADIVPIDAIEGEAHWAWQELSDVVAALELAYRRHLAGDSAPNVAVPQSWTWERAARVIVDALSDLIRRHPGVERPTIR